MLSNYEALVNLLACRLADDDYEQAVELLGEVLADKPQPLKLTSDKAAAVNQQTFWLKIGVDGTPLVGTRYQLINRAAGVAHVGPYRDDGWYTHYAGLPKFKD